MGADLLVETLRGLRSRRPSSRKSRTTRKPPCAPLLKKEDGLIDWTRPAPAIHNRVRGLQPWPGAQTTFRGQPLHIWKARVGDAAASAAPGSVLGARPLVVACGEGTLELLEVQLEGRKRIPAGDFANGQRLTENENLGEGSL